MQRRRRFRLKLLKEIEATRKSKAVVYFTGHGNPMSSMIAEDAVLPLFQHLLAIKKSSPDVRRVDLFLHTLGGDVSVPWRIVTMIREFCDEFSVIIPYKAYSAGTMIALGADNIIMGKKAELSPIDPTLVKGQIGGTTVTPSEISVEDVSSYVSFMRERVGLVDQNALAQVISRLADHITPLALGSVNRQHSHIRLVAEKLLRSRNDEMKAGTIESIIESITEKMYSHGHGIGRREAKSVNLPIIEPDEALEQKIWSLYSEYENALTASDSTDPEEILTLKKKEEFDVKNVPIAVIESIPRLDAYEISSAFRRKRMVPPNPQVNINLNLGFPPGLDPSKISKELQQIIQQMITQVSAAIPSIVQKEIIRQSPIIGIEGRSYGGRWKQKVKAKAKKSRSR